MKHEYHEEPKPGDPYKPPPPPGAPPYPVPDPPQPTSLPGKIILNWDLPCYSRNEMIAYGAACYAKAEADIEAKVIAQIQAYKDSAGQL
jgi:hypothetical protein